MNCHLMTSMAALLACTLAWGQDPTVPKDVGPLVELPSGLSYSVLKEGTGTVRPALHDTVVVQYSGWLAKDGSLFDSSLTREGKQPISFKLGQVIEGWNEGLTYMTAGARHKLYIPAALGYGAQAKGDKIPANSDLIFEVELIEVKKVLPKPDFNDEKATKTESGLLVQQVKAGQGAKPGPKDLVVIDFSVYDLADGKFIAASSTMRGGQMIGMSAAGGGPFPYLQDLLPQCQVGSHFAVKVPSDKLPTGRDGKPMQTIWHLEPKRIVAFEAPKGIESVTTESGLKIEIIRPGIGKKPGPTSAFTCHYAGWLDDGTVFDNSFARGEPTPFGMDRVVKGWTEGLQHISSGGAVRLTIPPDLAYGASGSPPVIPPDATLVFYIELISINGQ